MTKLMEQVKEIQRRAHVCPECEGKGEIAWPETMQKYGYTAPVQCYKCHGLGEVPAPDIDALVGVIEALVGPYAASMEGPYAEADIILAYTQADLLVTNGLPGEEDTHV